MTYTQYILMKRCINCWHLMEATLKACSQCNHFFRSEATEIEKLKAIERIEEMRQRADLN